ncbi:MAG: flavodoxin family protein [Deltaproteobacteria bacterium]|nr:flavodoxin family protein [Deltaproteobacteria bacterium]
MTANDNLLKKVPVDILPEQKILGISGSPRINGNSDVLLKHILKGVQGEDVPTESVHLRDYYFQPCIGCERCRKDKICTGLNDGMNLLYPKIIQARGLILLSPTHNYNITAWMKAFIDRLYCLYEFDDNRPRGWTSRLAGQNRKAVIVAVCEQQDKKDMGFTIEAMRLPLQALGYEIFEELPVLKIFDRGAVKKEEEILMKASELGRRFAKSIAEA